MEEQHQRALARLGDVETGAVGGDETVFPRPVDEDGGGVGRLDQ
jgi:hypothetical protein